MLYLGEKKDLNKFFIKAEKNEMKTAKHFEFQSGSKELFWTDHKLHSHPHPPVLVSSRREQWQ